MIREITKKILKKVITKKISKKISADPKKISAARNRSGGLKTGKLRKEMLNLDSTKLIREKIRETTEEVIRMMIKKISGNPVGEKTAGM